MLPLELALLFAAGVVQDALNAFYVRSIAERARARAVVLSGTITLLGCVILSWIFTHSQVNDLGANVVAYALGNSVGTYVGLRRGVPG